MDNSEAIKRVTQQYQDALKAGKLIKPISESVKEPDYPETLSHREKLERAIAYTREKYADVIKALEDK